MPAATSEPGSGSAFRVRLMLAAVANPTRSRPAPPRIYGYEGPRRTVLVVDDDVDHRELIRQILAPLGFTVLSAPDAAACLDLVAQSRPDLFLIDIAMPGMNGWDLARALRQAGDTQSAIVMMSANIGETPPVRGDEDDHDAALAKPFEIAALLELCRRLLRLDWIDRPIVAPAVAQPAAAISMPSSHHVAELMRLGEIGYVRGIEAKLSELEIQDPDAQPLVDELRRLVEAFDFRRYLSVLAALGDDE